MLFLRACAFRRFFSVLFWEVSGGRLYVLVMAMVGYGSVLLLVSCASLRSNGRNMGMLINGFRGFGSGSCAQVLYDFYDGVMDGWNG